MNQTTALPVEGLCPECGKWVALFVPSAKFKPHGRTDRSGLCKASYTNDWAPEYDDNENPIVWIDGEMEHR